MDYCSCTGVYIINTHVVRPRDYGLRFPNVFQKYSISIGFSFADTFYETRDFWLSKTPVVNSLRLAVWK